MQAASLAFSSNLHNSKAPSYGRRAMVRVSKAKKLRLGIGVAALALIEVEIRAEEDELGERLNMDREECMRRYREELAAEARFKDFGDMDTPPGTP